MVRPQAGVDIQGQVLATGLDLLRRRARMAVSVLA